MSYKFFQNRDCEFYPCHELSDTDNFSCLFCYCPLHAFNCPGDYSILNGIKDCSKCTMPHKEHNYDTIINFLKNNRI